MRAIVVLLGLLGLSHAYADEQAARKVYQQLHSGAVQEAFFRAFPKGGDLHNHMGGGIYPEQWIDIAVKRHFCVDEQRLILQEKLTSRCPEGMAGTASLQKDGSFYRRFVDLMTLRGKPNPHDYFFREGFQHVRMRIPGPAWADQLEAAVVHAYEQNLTYLELQVNPFAGADFAKIAAELPNQGSFAAWSDSLEGSARFHEFIESARKSVGGIEKELVRRRPAEAAAVRRRYIISVVRANSPAAVFSQLAAAAGLAYREPRVVAFNLVAAEDGEVALRDFRLHMQMVDFLRSRSPRIHVTLHAGEMTPEILGAAPGKIPDALTFHITESVRNGHAERIGHGTDVRYEADRANLLREMRERSILVEICLTSEELIQGLKPDENPFAAYRQAGVPVSLNTDDEGIFRSDLSHEFLRAARDYRLSYGDLKELARNSVEYSFLAGESLFRGHRYDERVPDCSAEPRSESAAWAAYRQGIGGGCRVYLDRNPKADAQLQLEHQFEQFESAGSLARFQ